MDFALTAYNSRGRPITSRWHRAWNKDRNGFHIHNSLMEVNQAQRHSGTPIGDLINFGQYEMMQKVAPSNGSVSVHAALTVGAYNWANQGFSFETTSQLNSHRSEFKSFARDRGVTLSDDDMKHFKEPCHFSSFDDGKLYVRRVGQKALKAKQIETKSMTGVRGEYPLTASEIESGKTQRMMVHLGKDFMLGRSWTGRWKAKRATTSNEAWQYALKYRTASREAWKKLNPAFKTVMQHVISTRTPAVRKPRRTAAA